MIMKTVMIKKKSIKVLAAALIVVTSINFAFSQKGPNYEKKKEMIETQKVAFITKYLDLSTTEAQNFWPVYNQYVSAKETLITKHKGNIINKKVDEMTDAEAETLVNQQIVQAQEMLDIRKTYLLKYKEVLPIKKLAKLNEAEREFKKSLLKQIKENNNPKNK